MSRYKETTEKSLEVLQVQSQEQLDENQQLTKSIQNLQQQNQILAEIKTQYEDLTKSYSDLTKDKSQIELLNQELQHKNQSLQNDLLVTRNDVEALKKVQECIENEKVELVIRVDKLMENCLKVEKDNDDLKAREKEFCETFQERKKVYDEQCAEMVRRIHMLEESLREKKREYFGSSNRYI